MSNLVRITFKIDKDIKTWYQQEAQKRGMNMSALIKQALYEYYKVQSK